MRSDEAGYRREEAGVNHGELLCLLCLLVHSKLSAARFLAKSRVAMVEKLSKTKFGVV
jgi:aminoglycoside N3'-acetyltransferase